MILWGPQVLKLLLIHLPFVGIMGTASDRTLRGWEPAMASVSYAGGLWQADFLHRFPAVYMIGIISCPGVPQPSP